VDILIEHITNNIPLISVHHEIKNADIMQIYNKCISWMEKNYAKIMEKKQPTYILASHERLSGVYGYTTPLDWPKKIEINISMKARARNLFEV
jgi:hypothetical protein